MGETYGEGGLSHRLCRHDAFPFPARERSQWLAERKKLLAHEKELTKQYDQVNAERRRLPMVKMEKNYTFDGPNDKPTPKELFDGRQQLIVFHFMFDLTPSVPIRT